MCKGSKLVALLVGLNLMLVATLVAALLQLPVAMAQAGGRGGEFLTAAGKAAGRTYEVQYLLDVSKRKLYAIYPSNPSAKELAIAPPRDLVADFGDAGQKPEGGGARPGRP